jgi:tetratricopeptide (TPR) repeat protein
VYEQVLKAEPNHAKALTHASRMLANIGGQPKGGDKDEKVKLIEKARVYGERAVQLAPGDIQAHLAFVISLGLLSEFSASPQEKIRYAKLIYTEGETMVRLDSTFAVAYFILGKWHFELARLNWMERLACEIFFGGMPEGVSMDKAVFYLQKASRLEPNTILYLFGEARIYHHLRDDKRAVALLKHAITLPIREPDDIIRKQRCQDLLMEIEKG